MANSNDLKPLYLILSDQLFLRTQAVDRLRARLEEFGPLDFNLSQYEAERANFQEVVDACNVLPFATPFRLVIVSGIEKLSASDSGLLAEYALNPSPTTVLALVGESCAKSSKLYKAVVANGAVLDRKAPSKKELPSTVVALARQADLSMTPVVAQALINVAGENLSVLSLSLEKIKAYLGSRKKVEVADVGAVIAQTAEVRVWDFIGALFNRNAKEALLLLNNLIEVQGEHISRLSSLVTRQLRECLSARVLIDRGDKSASTLAATLKKQAWQAQALQRQAQKFSTRELREALVDLAQVQYASRTGFDERLVFEKWILEHFA